MTIFSPSATGTTMSSIPRGPPEVVTFRYQHDTGSEMAYVPLAGSHEEAQEIAVRSLPTLAVVDPSLLVFTITIRYKATNERREIAISPKAWTYVTGKLVPYRVIDVKVTTPPSPVKTHYTPPSPEKTQYVPPYPDSPPPQYPGSPQKPGVGRKQHIPLPPMNSGTGYGYGFGWHDQVNHQHGRHYDGSFLDPNEMADRRSAGWSASSVKVGAGNGGSGLFSRWRQNGFGIFPITWDDQAHNHRRRTSRWRRERDLKTVHEDERENEHENESGRSYVPSLI